MSEHEQGNEEEGGQDVEEMKDLDVPDEESEDVKGGTTRPDERNIN